ncbi:hypothetical protein NNJEOMEG_02187 [Fundidesulfovibrio magnetotacticus]|uniref:YCII-related domain-containing protein n=1 Tax=Fundidesulfovibrio magnetotacticus TaxID=2730080 RepID=A0A6V8LP47_9BACT|nr:YciI family protein [Fundidesulfovibrio magnetotacticus]GFK94343.1 hypothetical protein NNJEOMEG_02187 [Fundidesulfovibrio magnetotacticus]
MQADQTYLMLFEPNRPDFLQTMTDEERSVMTAHGAHCRELAAQGRVVLLGVCTDGAYGVLVFRAQSPEESRAFFEADPAVRAGIVTPRLHPFQVAMP